MRAQNQKVRRWVDGWADGEGKNDAAGADRPDRTREEASERDGMEAHRAPCTSKMLIQQAGGPRAPLASLVAASWLNLSR